MNSLSKFKTLLAMPEGELRSRKGALADLINAGLAVVAEAEKGDARTTSDEVAALAARYLGTPDTTLAALKPEVWIKDMRTIAGSAVAQADGPEPSLPNMDAGAQRALADAQRGGQAGPNIETQAVVAGPDSTGLTAPKD